MHVLDRALDRALRHLRAVEARGAKRHQRPPRAARVGVARVGRVAPAAVVPLVLLDVLRVEDYLDRLGEQLVDLRLALLGHHSGDLGEEQRRDGVRVHLAVADLAEVARVVVVAYHVVERAVNELAVLRVTRNVPRGKARHSGERRNRHGFAVLSGERAVVLLCREKELESPLDRLVHDVRILCGVHNGAARDQNDADQLFHCADIIPKNRTSCRKTARSPSARRGQSTSSCRGRRSSRSARGGSSSCAGRGRVPSRPRRGSRRGARARRRGCGARTRISARRA